MTSGSKIVDTKSSLVKDSYYWKDSSGAISLVASLLKVEGAGTVATALVLIISIADQYECNKDGSLDRYIKESIEIDSSLYSNARSTDDKRKNWETLQFTTYIKILVWSSFFNSETVSKKECRDYCCLLYG